MTGKPRSVREWAGIFFRGIAMGIAEVIPGVSGGTIAFVSGIYDELVHTLAGLSRRSPLHYIASPVRTWREQNLSFLLILGLGMATAILAFARVLSYLLEVASPAVWSFFLGLIAASVVHLVRQLNTPGQGVALIGWASLGTVAGLLTLLLETGSEGGSLWLFFFGGMVAVCAWLLPAISGSFVLLVLGLYAPVLEAVNELDLAVLGVVAAGCASGLLLFARVLSWCMQRFRHSLLSFLTGFMFGALPTLWPWRDEQNWFVPRDYLAATGAEPLVLVSAATFAAGVIVLFCLARLDR